MGLSRLWLGSAPTGEESHERQDRDHKQDRMDDDAAGDRDDQQNDGQNQKHGSVLPSEISTNRVFLCKLGR